jgi:hypothetical protein
MGYERKENRWSPRKRQVGIWSVRYVLTVGAQVTPRGAGSRRVWVSSGVEQSAGHFICNALAHSAQSREYHVQQRPDRREPGSWAHWLRLSSNRGLGMAVGDFRSAVHRLRRPWASGFTDATLVVVLAGGSD